MHHTDPTARLNLAEGIMDGLGNPKPFFREGEPLCERPAFGMAVAQPGPGAYRDNAIGAKAF